MERSGFVFLFGREDATDEKVDKRSVEKHVKSYVEDDSDPDLDT